MDEPVPTTAETLAQPLYEFGPYRLDPVKRLLVRGGSAVPLTPRALDVLVVLVESRGRTVDKDELMRAVWPDTVVEENNLARSISTLRKVLGEAAGEHRYVVTLPGRGYRFVAPVREVGETRPVSPDPPEAGAPGLAGPPAGAAEGPAAAPGRRWSRRRAALVASAAALAALLAAAATWQARRTGSPAVPPIRSIAVLPFADLSAEGKQEYLADGITDALITELAGIRSLRVISRQSIVRYRGSTASAPQIARELGVDALLEGTTTGGAGRVRVTAQLIHAPSDQHLWAASYDRDLGDVLSLQTELARAVAGEVRAQVTAPEQARLARRGKIDPEAYDLYLRGRYFFNRRTGAQMDDSLLSAVKVLEQALARSPELAEAHATLSFAYSALAYNGALPSPEATSRADDHARRALELDPGLVDAHTARGANLAYAHWEWRAAEESFRRAIALAPNDAHARLWYGFLLLHLRRFDEAIAQSEAGLRTDPFHPFLAGNRIEALAQLGRTEEALRLARETVELEPAHAGDVGWLLLRSGREREALESFERAGSERGVAFARARLGDPAALRALVARVEERARAGWVAPTEAAVLYAALGEKDLAFERLEEAYRIRAPALSEVAFAWEYEPLRPDPRFADLLRRMNLR